MIAFGEDLSRYGTALAHWPVGARRRAEDLLSTSAAARAEFEDAKLVDEFLGDRTTLVGDGRLAERILAAQKSLDGIAADPVRPSFRPRQSAAMQAALFVVVAMAGLGSGRWFMSATAEYDVSGIFMICADTFYL
ncbi:hypothetical protein [Dongia sp.]|uniref:hypothetical protein n=1 Tax=Dongia sp. TaxID=1977262 RepID=UPI0035B48CFC